MCLLFPFSWRLYWYRLVVAVVTKKEVKNAFTLQYEHWFIIKLLKCGHPHKPGRVLQDQALRNPALTLHQGAPVIHKKCFWLYRSANYSIIKNKKLKQNVFF